MEDLIAAHVAHLRAAGYAEDTIEDRAGVLRRAAAAMPHGLEATATEVELWLGDRRFGRWARYTYFHHLAGFYRWALARGLLAYNPMTELQRPRKPRGKARPLSEPELAIALTVRGPWRTAVILAAFDGLRAGEIARLRREDVTPDWLVVHRKGGEDQLLPTHALVWAELVDAPLGPVVRTATGRPFTPAYLSTSTSRELGRLGLVDATLHRCRHRFGTLTLLPRELGGAGADIRTVQALMGHADVDSTQIYTQVTDRQLRAAIAALPVPGGVASGVT